MATCLALAKMKMTTFIKSSDLRRHRRFEGVAAEPVEHVIPERHATLKPKASGESSNREAQAKEVRCMSDDQQRSERRMMIICSFDRHPVSRIATLVIVDSDKEFAAFGNWQSS